MLSPSLASTVIRGFVNSAGMAKNIKKKILKPFIAVYSYSAAAF